MPAVRIIVADAQELVADGLRYRLADQRGMEVVAHASTGKALFEYLKENKPTSCSWTYRCREWTVSTRHACCVKSTPK